MTKKLLFIILAVSMAFVGASFLTPNVNEVRAGAFTDGSFVRVNNSPVVYQIDGAQKRPVPSPAILFSWTNWSGVKIVSSEDLSVYTSGPAIGFKNETLIKPSDNPTVYVIKNNKRYAFASGTALKGLGYSFSKIRIINQRDLGYNPSARGSIGTEHIIVGQDFVKDASGTKYYVSKGNLREFTSNNVFTAWGSPVIAYTITDWQKEIYRSGAPMPFPNYSLIRQAGTQTIYLIVAGRRRAFSSQSIFDALHYAMSDVLDVSAAELSLNQPGSAIKSSEILPQGSLVQSGGKTVYRIDNNYRRAIPAAVIYLTHGSWSQLKQITLDTLGIYRSGPTQGFANSAIIRAEGNPTVYIIINEERRPFASGAAFLTLGYSWSQIRVVASKYLSYNPLGGSITVSEDATAMKQEGNIRVGIYKTTGGIRVAASGTYYVKTAEGQIIATHPGSVISGVSYVGGQYRYTTSAGHESFYSSYIKFIPAAGTVLELKDYRDQPSTVNYNRFRGMLETRRSSTTGEFWAINELPLETYIKGLGEAYDSFPVRYHQALSIVERTYARYYVNEGGKHPQNNFDLDHHVDMFYRGYESEIRMPTYVAAVDATRGKFITYQNKIVITPFYAESDGRTRAWSEVWNGEREWLQSVSAPFSTTMRGHGVGMDANSARNMASEWGYTYDRIIHHFYTDIAIVDRY